MNHGLENGLEAETTDLMLAILSRDNAGLEQK
jgi:hypothetical protein